MSVNRATFLKLLLWPLVALVGCAHSENRLHSEFPLDELRLSEDFSDPLGPVDAMTESEVAATPEPRHVQSVSAAEYWDLSLDDVIRISLQNGRVLRDLGGRLVTQSGQSATTFNPTLIRSDARTGVDAALSAFDTQLSSSLQWRRNNRGLKQPPPGVNNIEIDQLIHQQRSSVSKLLRSGTRVELQQGLDYDRDNLGVPPNRFSSAYTPFVGAEVRHPLARGGGRMYNEIAGPNAGPGVYNGILIATLRTELAETDFQIALRDYLYNIVRNYWFLRFAYERMGALESNLEVSRKLYDAAERKAASGLIDIDGVNAAQERVIAAELALQSAFAGGPERQLAGILGTSGAFLSGAELGALAVERRLRFLMGLPASDGRLIRPVDAPSTAPMRFDWHETLALALSSRPELQRQQTLMKQKRLELLASRNQLLPTVDLIAQYRMLGFGDHLSGNQYIAQDGALDELANGELQEWAAGMEVKWPVGNRIGWTAQRNALLALTREEEVFRQQLLQISHEISSAVSELKRAQSALDLSRLRWQVARERWQSAQKKLDDGLPIAIEVVLEAQARDAEASTGLAIATADYGIAVTAFNVARGSLLRDLCVNLIEEPLVGNIDSQQDATPRTANAMLLTPGGSVAR